jgi:hypothetical protein
MSGPVTFRPPFAYRVTFYGVVWRDYPRLQCIVGMDRAVEGDVAFYPCSWWYGETRIMLTWRYP